jgi:cation:H+ antiporter
VTASLAFDLLVFTVGLCGLYFGAEWLVGGSARLAAAFGVSSFIVGLTLVSFGTSAPELLVSGLASYRGSGGLAVGNVLGSNIANIALILGVVALIFPIAVGRELIVRDLPIMIGVVALVPIFGLSGTISRLEGVLLLVFFAAYAGYLGLAARRESASVLALLREQGHPRVERREILQDAGIATAGLVVLALGAHLLVGSAIDIARVIGVSEVVIGLTLVAFGTSLPELAASISAARRGDAQIVIGNIVGSNIFNLSLILGAAALIRPLPVTPSTVWVDAPIVLGLSVAMLPVVYSGRRIDRWEGGVLLATYVGFLVWAAG